MRSRFGIKIKNVQVATLVEKNNGLRYKYETTDAMLNTSLFLDYIEKFMTIERDGSTRDFICCQYDFGCKSYEERRAEILKTINKREEELNVAVDENDGEKINTAKILIESAKKSLDFCDANKHLYKKMTKEQLREDTYVNGIYIDYKRTNRNGNEETKRIHYKMLFRSTGKAKLGQCMFVNEKIYNIAHDYLYAGRKLEDVDKIVELSSYVPLVASTICDRIKIEPEQMLILPDVDRPIRKKALNVFCKDGHGAIELVDNMEIPSVLFDGEGLIDESIFPKEKHHGFVLLRNFFFKCCAFRASVQDFFKDKLGDKYEDATAVDAYGNTIRLKDVKLVTTVNSLKIAKINYPYSMWAENVRKYGSVFGIVKSAHPSKLTFKDGTSYQRMSYQFVNSLTMDGMDDVMLESVNYVERLKNEDEFFLEHLDRTKNFMNDNSALLAIVSKNKDFILSNYFKERRASIIKTFVREIRSGKVLQHATNATVVFNPYGLLLHAIGKNPDEDKTLPVLTEGISCYCPRFKNGAKIACFRSPFNSKNNIVYCVNRIDSEMLKYFPNFTNEIIAINANGTDVQARANGMDADSDFMYCVENSTISQHAKWCEKNYPTIVNSVGASSKKWHSDLKSFAELDSLIAKGNTGIGESSNFAQISQSYSYTFPENLTAYDMEACLGSIYAQLCIDSAKRMFELDTMDAISESKKRLNITENLYPEFWVITHEGFSRDKVNSDIVCPMNVCCRYQFPRANTTHGVPTDEFLSDMGRCKPDEKTVKNILELFSGFVSSYLNSIEDECDARMILAQDNFEDIVGVLRRILSSRRYIGVYKYLIRLAMTDSIIGGVDYSLVRKNRTMLVALLYETNPTLFLECISERVEM